MPEKKMTEQEGLAIIQQMIDTAKQEQKDDGIGWIIWGWLLFAASFLSFFNNMYNWFSQYFFWNIFGILSVAILAISFGRSFFAKKPPVKTYTSDLFKKLNLGFSVTLLLHILAINRGVGPITGFALLSALYGFWILIYGAALSFRPSLIGAWVTWACAAAGLYAESFEMAMLFHGAGVLAGYIIPGHLALQEFRKTQRKSNV